MIILETETEKRSHSIVSYRNEFNSTIYTLRKLEKELEEEQKREEQRLKEREMEKQRLKQKQLEERRKNQEEDIMKSNMSEAEKNRLLQEHNENMEKLEENLREEQERLVPLNFLFHLF